MLEAVSKALFDADVARLTARQAKLYGWSVVTADYPVFDVIFLHETKPHLRVRFTCDGWNDLPPRITLLTPDGQPVQSLTPGGDQTYAEVFQRGKSVFNPGPHDDTRLPFICMRGSREYHTHCGHRADVWDNYRDATGNDLLGLMVQLWNVWKASIQ